jgi:fucose permease
MGKETSVAVLARSRIGAIAPKAQKYRQRMVGSLIVMAIVGGALIPPLMGKIADTTHSMALAYVVHWWHISSLRACIAGMHPPGA